MIALQQQRNCFQGAHVEAMHGWMRERRELLEDGDEVRRPKKRHTHYSRSS